MTAIKDSAVIIKMLTHLGLPSRAPPKSLVRLHTFIKTA